MKLLKKVFIGLGVFLVILLGFTFYGIYEMDGLVKSAIEKYGTEAVKAKVSVGSVNVSLKNAKVTLKNLTVANPDGFKEKNAFHASEVIVDLDEKNIGADRVVVQKISVAVPQITYEHSPAGDNLTVLQNNAVSYAKDVAQKMGVDSSKSSKKSDTKILIRDVYLNDGSLVLRDSRLFDASMKLPLPNIHVSKIGNGEDGSSPDEIAGQVMDSVFGATKRAVTESAPAALEQAGVKLKEVGKSVGSTAKDAGSKAVNDLKKLFSN